MPYMTRKNATSSNDLPVWSNRKVLCTKIRSATNFSLLTYVQTLADDICIRTNHVSSVLETIINCLIGYISVGYFPIPILRSCLLLLAYRSLSAAAVHTTPNILSPASTTSFTSHDATDRFPVDHRSVTTQAKCYSAQLSHSPLWRSCWLD